MEDKKDNIINELLISRKNESRSLLRKCFKNPMFSFVPFEIWRDIVCTGNTTILCRISQTCWGFRELVANLRELLLEHALKYRREDKIPQASILIKRCANIGNSGGMFHLGYAYYNEGWGVKKNLEKSMKWLKNSAELGNGAGMVYYAKLLRYGLVGKKDLPLSEAWIGKALSSNNSNFAIGYCYYWGYGIKEDYEKAVEFFEMASNEGDEYGQYMNAICSTYGAGTNQNYQKSFHWHLRAAEQGFCTSQYLVAEMYRYGKGCILDIDKAFIWYGKAANQGEENSKRCLDNENKKNKN